MKILIFEYITGGGCNKQNLPDSLKQEGSLMLQALLDNLSGIAGIDVLVMLDHRLVELINRYHFETVIIDASQNSDDEFLRYAKQCNAIWPIAPESNGTLYTLCQTVESLGKQLLTSPSSAVQATGNKFHTYQELQKHAIETVPTWLATNEMLTKHFPPLLDTKEWMIKPIDGVGCIDSWIITDWHEFSAIAAKERYIIQPHWYGQKTSLSCLFKSGLAWIVCHNTQRFTLQNKRYQLTDILVNDDPNIDRYQNLVDDIAYVFPDLWGYVGIDLIETPDNIWVLEINPRLTTAFVGIEAALGINIANTTLQLLQGSPTVKPLRSRPITVTLPQENHAR